MNGRFLITSLEKMVNWAQTNSLRFVSAQEGCCADELLNALGCRYDLERFGCVPETVPQQADLLIVSGALSYKAVEELHRLYERMMHPKYVMAVGACANCGGMFSPQYSYSTVPGVDRVIPVDVYVPGCPPRPEAIMHGLLTLQEKIRGNRGPSATA